MLHVYVEVRVTMWTLYVMSEPHTSSNKNKWYLIRKIDGRFSSLPKKSSTPVDYDADGGEKCYSLQKKSYPRIPEKWRAAERGAKIHADALSDTNTTNDIIKPLPTWVMTNVSLISLPLEKPANAAQLVQSNLIGCDQRTAHPACTLYVYSRAVSLGELIPSKTIHKFRM